MTYYTDNDDNNEHNNEHNTYYKAKLKKFIDEYGKYIAPLAIGTCVSAYALLSYKVCNPTHYLVKTGLGVKDIKIARKFMKFPFQKIEQISLEPKTFKFDLHNMSSEKVEFRLPVVFTLAPYHPQENKDLFIKHASTVSMMKDFEISNTIKGMIEGESRLLTASMTIEEMFSSKDVFSKNVVAKISNDLETLGLKVLNANIREMTDYDGNNKYFEYRKQRAIQTANYQAQRDVSKAKKDGECSVALNEAETKIRFAELKKEAEIKENNAQTEIQESLTLLAEAEALKDKRSQVAQIEATMEAKRIEIERQRHLETLRQKQELESQRADVVSKEIAISEAKERCADALYYQKMKEGDAEYYMALKKAEGIRKMYEAQTDGMKNLVNSCGDNPDLVKFALGVESGLYDNITKNMSDAVRGLNPKISVWNTGGGNSSDATKPVFDVLKNFAPFLETLNEQTNIKLPEWMPQASSRKQEHKLLDIPKKIKE